MLKSLCVLAAVAAIAAADCSHIHKDLANVHMPAAPDARVAMTLHMMPDEVANGAVCLDGTPTGFYFSAATDAASKNKWQLYFQGGGWCYNELDCWSRSKGSLGSSKSWANTSSLAGLLSDDCNINPTFCNWNRVMMPYCDGNSFSGNRDEPIVVNGDKIYFRGHRNIDATLRALMKLGLNTAEEVMLTGCSAGGLATYLHTDYVGAAVKAIPSVTKFKAASISGFFLNHNTVEDKPVYPEEIKYIFTLSNATHGVNDDCIADKASSDQWRCNFGPGVYPYIKNPIFPLDSVIDAWQSGCILTAEPVVNGSTANGNCSTAPGWKACAGNIEQCDARQIVNVVQYQKDFVTAMSSASTYDKNGNGMFVYSCHTHCAAQDNNAYTKYTINNVTMQQAVTKWWNSDDSTPAPVNRYSPCIYNLTPPYECNPSCGD